MRPSDPLMMPTAHGALSNVTPDQHHRKPTAISVSNTTQSVAPLPGGPGVWDIAVPYDTQVVSFSFRSIHVTEQAGATAGVTGIATRNMFDTSTVSVGGHGVLSSKSYNAVYTKAASAMNLSHKVFSSLGSDIALTNAYLTTTGPTTRVFRTEWTNYGYGNRTLHAYGEVGLL